MYPSLDSNFIGEILNATPENMKQNNLRKTFIIAGAILCGSAGAYATWRYMTPPVRIGTSVTCAILAVAGEYACRRIFKDDESSLSKEIFPWKDGLIGVTTGLVGVLATAGALLGYLIAEAAAKRPAQKAGPAIESGKQPHAPSPSANLTAPSP